MSPKTESNCGKCGLCLNVCPVYQQMKEEQASPRARMQLIKSHDQNNLASSAYLKEIMSKCLMCGSCAATCPSGINHYDAFMKMREKMAKDHGEPPAIKSLIYLLGRDYRTRISTNIAKAGQKLIPGAIQEVTSVGSIPLKNMPTLNTVPFRKACTEVIDPDGDPVGTVAYYTGCATNYLFDDTGFSAIGILKLMGFRIIIPKHQTCCSIPLLFHGAAKQAHKNIETNIQALKGVDTDHILTDCSTCGEALREIYPTFFKTNKSMTEDALEISDKVVDILTFIEQRFDLLHFRTDLAKNKKTVTYHAPCHSKNSKFGHAQRLIEKLPFIDYIKTCDTEECCGGGGTFFYEYPDLSKKMIDKKIKNAKAVKASTWLTDCPVCRMNLSGNLTVEDSLDVVHPLTLIYKALNSDDH